MLSVTAVALSLVGVLVVGVLLPDHATGRPAGTLQGPVVGR